MGSSSNRKSQAVTAESDLPRQYRDIARLPSTWRVLRLEEVLSSISNGLSARQSSEPGGVPVTRIETIADDRIDADRVRYVEDPDPAVMDRYRLVPGDILVSHINSEPQIGRAVLYTGEPDLILHGMNLLRLQLDEETCNPSFLVHLFRLYRATGVFRGLAARAVGQSSINQGRLKALVLPLPPLAEQRAIVITLDQIQEAVEATDHVLSRLRKLKRAVARHLLTRGLTAIDERPTLKKTSMGELPAKWVVKPLGDFASARGGYGFPPALQGRSEGGYPFYKVSDMNLPGNETHLGRANHYIDDPDLKQLRARVFPEGAIAFPKVGGALYTNKKRLLTQDALLDNNVMGVAVENPDECLPEYLFRWFEQVNLRDFSNPGPLPSITASAVKDADVPLPPVEEQRKIVVALDAVDQRIRTELALRRSREVVYRSALKEVISGQRRVTTGARTNG